MTRYSPENSVYRVRSGSAPFDPSKDKWFALVKNEFFGPWANRAEALASAAEQLAKVPAA